MAVTIEINIKTNYHTGNQRYTKPVKYQLEEALLEYNWNCDRRATLWLILPNFDWKRYDHKAAEWSSQLILNVELPRLRWSNAKMLCE